MKPVQFRVYPPSDAPLAGNGGQRLAQPDDAPVQNASTDEPPRWLLWVNYPLRLPLIIGIGCFVLLVSEPQPSATVDGRAYAAEIVLGWIWALLAWAVIAAIRNRRITQ